MSRFPLLLLLVGASILVGCGDDEVLGEGTAPVAGLRGAPIDGTGDAGFEPQSSAPAPVEVATESADTADTQVADASEDTTAALDDGALAGAGADDAAAEVADPGGAPTEDEATTQDAVVTDAADGAEGDEGDEATAEGEEVERPQPDEDGVYHLVFSDLSLEGEDIDNIIDYLLFPEEFEEGEGFQFPEHLKALDGKPITISGYMIPGRIRKNKVRDFMLVRDLAGCCFGGAPNPDEWIDVVMVDDAEAEYLRYLPITVHGTLSLIGEQDQEGYAVGVYRMKATWAGEKD